MGIALGARTFDNAIVQIGASGSYGIRIHLGSSQRDWPVFVFRRSQDPTRNPDKSRISSLTSLNVRKHVEQLCTVFAGAACIYDNFVRQLRFDEATVLLH